MECAKLERENQLYIDRMNSKASELEKCFCESQEVKDLRKAEEKLAQLLEKSEFVNNLITHLKYTKLIDESKETRWKKA